MSNQQDPSEQRPRSAPEPSQEAEIDWPANAGLPGLSSSPEAAARLGELDEALGGYYRGGDSAGWKDYMERLSAEGAKSYPCSGNKGGVTIVTAPGGESYCLKVMEVGEGQQPLAGIKLSEEIANLNAGPGIIGASLYFDPSKNAHQVLLVSENLRAAPDWMDHRNGMFFSVMGVSGVVDVLDFLEGHPRELEAIIERSQSLLDGDGMSFGHPDPHLNNAILRAGRLAPGVSEPPGWQRVEGSDVVWRVDLIDPFSGKARDRSVMRGQNDPQYNRDYQTEYLRRNLQLE